MLGQLEMLDWTVMGGYLLAVILLGIWFSRREDSTDDFLLGGRCMPWWAVGISLMVSLLSTVSMVAAPGEAYNHGLTLAVFSLALMLLFGIPAFFVFVRFYFRVKTYTPFEYLERRFDHRVRLIGSLTFWLMRLIYLGTVLFSSAKVFEGASNWPVWLTIVLVGIIGTFYTTMGGMKAVIWTDVMQFAVLAIGIVVLLEKCAANVPGGIGGIIDYAFLTIEDFRTCASRVFSH